MDEGKATFERCVAEEAEREQRAREEEMQRQIANQDRRMGEENADLEREKRRLAEEKQQLEEGTRRLMGARWNLAAAGAAYAATAPPPAFLPLKRKAPGEQVPRDHAIRSPSFPGTLGPTAESDGEESALRFPMGRGAGLLHTAPVPKVIL